MKHVALLGDSVFDNGAYVAPHEPDVPEQLRDRLTADDVVDCLAVDGDLTKNVIDQLETLSEPTTHLVVSVVGNDALGYLNILDAFQEPVSTIQDSLLELNEIRSRFREQYRAMLCDVLEEDLPTVICTIYEGSFPDHELRTAVETVLPVINDVIYDEAIREGLPLLDLKRICDEPRDYANPIEPSAHGGSKIVDSIIRVLENHDFQSSRTEVFAGNAT
jgi:hypothetical protein